MKKIILVLSILCMYTGLAQVQNELSYKLSDQHDQYTLGDLVVGYNNYYDNILFEDNGNMREWLFLSCSRGSIFRGDYQEFGKLYEKIDGVYIEIYIELKRILTGGAIKFAQLNPLQDNIPDLIYSGSDGEKSYTDIYLSSNDQTLKFSQSLYGAISNSIAIMLNSQGDGFINNGINGQDNVARTKIYRNDKAGKLIEVFDGGGGAYGSTHHANIDGGPKRPIVHGTNFNSVSINKKHIKQSDGTFKQVDSGLPPISSGSSFFTSNNPANQRWIGAGRITSDPGKPELIIVEKNDGSGNFTRVQQFPGGSAMRLVPIANNAGFLAFGSGWGSGHDHIGVYVDIDGVITEWTNHPFNSQSTYSSDFGIGFHFGPGAIETDINGDGLLDIIMFGPAGDAISRWPDYKIQVYINTSKTLSSQTQQVNEITLFPNPVKYQLTIDIPGEIIKSYQVFDINGRQIGMVRGNIKKFDMSHYAQGFYVIKGTTQSGKTFNGKVFKK